MPLINQAYRTLSEFSNIGADLFGTNALSGVFEDQILKDSRYAANVYGSNIYNQLDHIPRHRFMFYSVFNRPIAQGGEETYGDWRNGISFFVKSVDRPRFSADLVTVNEYNKKRVIQRSIQYQPITMTFYDTYDDRALSMILDYFKFYYGDFEQLDYNGWNHDMATADYYQPGSYGYRTPATSELNNSNQAYFFSHLDLYQFGVGKYTKFQLIHPKIVEYTPSPMDSGDTASAAEITITLQYEGLVVANNDFQQPITPEVAQMMGIEQNDIAQYYDLPLTNIGNNYFNGNKDILSSALDAASGGVLGNVASAFSRTTGIPLPTLPPNYSRAGVSALSSFGNFDFGEPTYAPDLAYNRGNEPEVLGAYSNDTRNNSIARMQNYGVTDKKLAEAMSLEYLRTKDTNNTLSSKLFNNLNKTIGSETQLGIASGSNVNNQNPLSRALNKATTFKPSVMTSAKNP